MSKTMNLTSLAEDQFILGFNHRVFFQVRMNLLFAFFILVEVVFLFLFFPFFVQSALIALMLAAILLTIFGFLLLRQYWSSQKLFYYKSLLHQLIGERHPFEEQKDVEKYVEIGKLLAQLADRLYNHEYKYYSFSFLKKFVHLNQWIEFLSAWIHWEDVHEMRELLLKEAVEEHLALVRVEPTNPDAHALLANAYVMLSGLYVDPRILDIEDKEKRIPQQKSSEKMRVQFQGVAKKAIEEFKILKEYSPNDPWIYSQLAYSYRDLQMPENEKEAYEAILSLRPHDHETRFKLGCLYFQQGENARGLKIYEDLKNAHYSNADELLKIYGGEFI